MGTTSLAIKTVSSEYCLFWNKDKKQNMRAVASPNISSVGASLLTFLAHSCPQTDPAPHFSQMKTLPGKKDLHFLSLC